jgi:hypothetical protein
MRPFPFQLIPIRVILLEKYAGTDPSVASSQFRGIVSVQSWCLHDKAASIRLNGLEIDACHSSGERRQGTRNYGLPYINIEGYLARVRAFRHEYVN